MVGSGPRLCTCSKSQKAQPVSLPHGVHLSCVTPSSAQKAGTERPFQDYLSEASESLWGFPRQCGRQRKVVWTADAAET